MLKSKTKTKGRLTANPVTGKITKGGKAHIRPGCTRYKVTNALAYYAGASQ